jgi:hypothetical protein
VEGVVAVGVVQRFERGFFQGGEQGVVFLVLGRESDDGRRAASNGGPGAGREVVGRASLAKELGFCQVNMGVDPPGLKRSVSG